MKDFGCVLGGKASAKGDIELAKTMMRGSKLDFPIKAKFALSADQAFDNVSIQYLNLALGAATLQASGSVSKGALDLRVNTNDSSLREVAMLAGAAGVVFNPDYKIDGRLTLDVSARGPANNPQLNGKITLKNVNASGGHLKEAVSTPEIDVALTPQSIVTNTFAAKSGPAALSGSLTLMNYRTAHPVFQFALALDRIDTEELKGLMAKNSAHAQGDSASLLETILTNATGGGTLSVKRLQARQILLSALSTTVKLDHGLVTLSPLSADAFHGKISGSVGADIRPGMPGFSLDAKLTGVDANALLSAVSSMKNELYGTLDARTKLKFALASGGDLAKSLNGTVDFSLANGELKNADILGEVSKFLNLMGGKGAPPGSGSSTQLKQFSGTLNIANGVAATNNLKASTVSGTIAAKGSLNLVNEALDLHMTVGTGLLAMPVLVTGTTAHMKFAPDLEALAKMKLGGVMGSIFGALGQKKQ